MWGHNYGGIPCRKCGLIHNHPRGTLGKKLVFPKSRNTKISSALKERTHSPEWNAKISQSRSGKHYPKLSEAKKGKRLSEHVIRKSIELGHTPEINAKRSETMKMRHKEKPQLALRAREQMLSRWSDEKYREDTLKRIIKGLVKRPTSLERRIMSIIFQNNIPLKYTGDGSFIIGYKNPDFININGKKKCLEVGNKIFHDSEYEHKRIDYFGKWGWDCLVLWEENMGANNDIARRIISWMES